MAEKSTKTKTSGKTASGKAVTKSTGTKATTKVPSKSTAKPAKKKATFKLRAPEATQVYVVGCFNEWDTAANPLRLGDEGTWTCTLMLEPGEHEYRFVVDGVWWDDPMAAARRPNEFGCENCVVIV
jgi:1,4-alpha-glucan branching enzyme